MLAEGFLIRLGKLMNGLALDIMMHLKSALT